MLRFFNLKNKYKETKVKYENAQEILYQKLKQEQEKMKKPQKEWEERPKTHVEGLKQNTKRKPEQLI